MTNSELNPIKIILTIDTTYTVSIASEGPMGILWSPNQLGFVKCANSEKRVNNIASNAGVQNGSRLVEILDAHGNSRFVTGNREDFCEILEIIKNRPVTMIFEYPEKLEEKTQPWAIFHGLKWHLVEHGGVIAQSGVVYRIILSA